MRHNLKNFQLRPELQLYFKAADPIAILLFQKLSAIFKLRQQQFKSHVNMVTQVVSFSFTSFTDIFCQNSYTIIYSDRKRRSRKLTEIKSRLIEKLHAWRQSWKNNARWTASWLRPHTMIWRRNTQNAQDSHSNCSIVSHSSVISQSHSIRASAVVHRRPQVATCRNLSNSANLVVNHRCLQKNRQTISSCLMHPSNSRCHRRKPGEFDLKETGMRLNWTLHFQKFDSSEHRDSS